MIKLLVLCIMAAAVSATTVVRLHRVHKTHISTYQILNWKYSWFQARAHCRRCGGFLATIDDSSEHYFLRSQLSKLKINRAWIGLNDRAREGTFRWDKGNAFGGFKSWHKGEPNNLGGKEDCVEMNKAHSWRLNDIDCTTKVGFICEINASKTVLNQYHW